MAFQTNGHHLTKNHVDEAALRLAVTTRELLGLPWERQSSTGKCIQSEFASSSASPVTPWTPPVLESPPSPLAFLQRVHNESTPFLIKGCLDDRPAANKWKQPGYLETKMGDGKVKVACTNDGHADDIKMNAEGKLVFALPAEVDMSFETLMRRLREQEPGKPVVYLQSQNSNLCPDIDDTDGPSSGDFSPLIPDLLPPSTVNGSSTPSSSSISPSFATTAFSSPPTATNLWIGSTLSQSSTHNDSTYDNLMTVLVGTKVFTLFPPTEAHFLCQDEDEAGMFEIWRHSDQEPYDQLVLESSSSSAPMKTPWIPISPLQPPSSPRNAAHPRYGLGLKPLQVVVEAGMTLFLPAGWYHHVGNVGLTIAVNFWYDCPSAFGAGHALLDFVKDVGQIGTRRLGGDEEEGRGSRADEVQGLQGLDIDSDEEQW